VARVCTSPRTKSRPHHPAFHLHDLYLTEPAKWLRATIAQHGGVQLEAA
jgi:hypothetical protein